MLLILVLDSWAGMLVRILYISVSAATVFIYMSFFVNLNVGIINITVLFKKVMCEFILCLVNWVTWGKSCIKTKNCIWKERDPTSGLHMVNSNFLLGLFLLSSYTKDFTAKTMGVIKPQLKWHLKSIIPQQMYHLKKLPQINLCWKIQKFWTLMYTL